MTEKIPEVKKQPSENDIAVLLLFTALLFGAWLRLVPAFMARFPLNDGGMFFTMIQDLRQNHYILPVYTSYNNLQIPYVYPPLPFYLASFLGDVFHISDFIILLWLPSIINILTIPAFALLAQSMMGSKLKAAQATLFYSLTPLSMDWFLMGGGLTRGFGQLFMLLTAWGSYMLFSNHARKYLLITILSGALVMLSHPESALLTVTSAAIIWFFTSRSKQTFIDATLAVAGITLLCSPWLVYVLRLHGITPFINAMQTNGNSLFLWAAIFPFNFTQESGLALLAMLGLVGLFIKLGQEEYLLPAWVIIPFFINPRSSARAAIIPLAMLAAFCLQDVVLPAIRGSIESPKRSRNIFWIAFAGYVLIYLIINAYGLALRIADDHLKDTDQQAMAWIRQNTPVNSKFIILTGETQMMRDPVQEWFPALTRRTSLTTLQGREWLWGEKFIQSIVTYQGVKNCIQKSMACLNEQSEKLKLSYDHIYISKENAQSLVNELSQSEEYETIYENESSIVLAVRP